MVPERTDSGGQAAATADGGGSTHGYDDQGARFGPTGNFEQWWTPQDAKKLAALTGKLARQYSGYTLMGQKVNGNLTLGENADLGGLNIAYDALQPQRTSRIRRSTG